MSLKLVGYVVQTPKALPPLIWGPPGIGKSSRLYQLAARLSMMLETVIAGIREPADFGGMPMPSMDGKRGIHLEPPPGVRN